MQPVEQPWNRQGMANNMVQRIPGAGPRPLTGTRSGLVDLGELNHGAVRHLGAIEVVVALEVLAWSASV